MSASSGYSIIDDLLDGRPVEFRGEGTLTLRTVQDDPPTGPGRVQFRLRYAPVEAGEPHTRAIKLALDALDEDGGKILEWNPAEGRRPLPQYDLDGSVEWSGRTTSVRMAPVLVDDTMPAAIRYV